MPKPAEIRSARERAGLTQTGAAELLGVHQVTWARYEAGDRSMQPHEWAYWKHVAGLERIPFKSRKPDNAGLPRRAA
jgi:putative transcriptional regulator